MMKLGSYLKYGIAILALCFAASTFYLYRQLEEARNSQYQTTVSTTYDTDGDIATDKTQEQIVEVGVATENATEIAVVPRPIDEATQVKDPVFLDVTNKNTKIYARINGEDKLIELPTTLTTETKIGDAKIYIDEKRTTVLDLRTPKQYAEFGVGKVLTGSKGYSFSYEVPIGGAGIKGDLRYDTDDHKIVAMIKFPLKK